MGLLQERFKEYREPQKYMDLGIYPYFREIDSHQDTEVVMDGKKSLCSDQTHTWDLLTTSAL